jgi:lactoylglutathione lyase
MKLEHVALYVDDLEAMREFYCDHLGAQANAKYRNATTGFESYFLSFESGAQVEIMSHPETVVNDPVGGAGRHLKSLGYIHLAFSLGSRDAVDRKTNDLAQAGVVILSQPRQTGDGYYESVILDPEGNQIELVA